MPFVVTSVADARANVSIRWNGITTALIGIFGETGNASNTITPYKITAASANYNTQMVANDLSATATSQMFISMSYLTD